MGEDYRSWRPQQHLNWQSQNWNSLTALPDLRQGNAVTAHMNHGTNTVYRHGNFPVHAVTQLPNHQPMGQANEPHGWFYGLSQFRQAFTPVTISTVEEKVPEALPTDMGSGPVEKRFLVFDQSGDQTTLVFGSDTRKPMQFPTWIKQFPGEYNLNRETHVYRSDINHPSGPMLTDKVNEDHDSDQVSEMHEDTEELNALLYSDDESDYTEDEVTSTGHSPGSLTDHGNEGSTEDLASCNIPTRKRKVSDDKHADIQSLEDTASSGNLKRSTEYENDAESSCAGGNSPWSDEMDSSSKNKRMRREKLKETINILQRIVPSGKGKDATVVIDEAIQYLKSLKLKAKALGLGTL